MKLFNTIGWVLSDYRKSVTSDIQWHNGKFEGTMFIECEEYRWFGLGKRCDKRKVTVEVYGEYVAVGPRKGRVNIYERTSGMQLSDYLAKHGDEWAKGSRNIEETWCETAYYKNIRKTYPEDKKKPLFL